MPLSTLPSGITFPTGDFICLMAVGLILDDKGTLKKENKSVGYNDDEGVEFGDEPRRLAKKLKEEMPFGA